MAIAKEGGPSAKRPRATTAPTTTCTALGEESAQNRKSTEAGTESTANGKGVTVNLADPNLLDCPICFEPLSSPVYQCENGHIACGPCCTTILKNKCSNCSLPIQNIRCRAVEKILESVTITCQNKPYGCKKMLSYSKKLAHEKACNCSPCSCPCCDFVGNFIILRNHFALKHKDSSMKFDFGSTFSLSVCSTQKHFILREGRVGEIFVLNHCVETLGSFFNVVCVGTSASEAIYCYELTASIGDDSIKVKTSVEMVSKWAAQPPGKMSLLVPTSFTSKSPVLQLALMIRYIGIRCKPLSMKDFDFLWEKTAHAS